MPTFPWIKRLAIYPKIAHGLSKIVQMKGINRFDEKWIPTSASFVLRIRIGEYFLESE